jgi:predicted HicB family RNase H-like nuclease
MLPKSLDYYKSIDYNIIVKKEELDGEKWYIAYCNEFGLNACHGTGDTEIEAINSFKIEKELFIEYLFEEGIEIPEAENLQPNNYSGVFSIRTTPWIHYHLVRQAKHSNLSLNSYINTILTFKLSQDMISDCFLNEMNRLKQDICQPVEDLLERTNSLIYNKRTISFPTTDYKREEYQQVI